MYMANGRMHIIYDFNCASHEDNVQPVPTLREQPADSIKGTVACLLVCLWSLSMFLENFFWSLC